MDIYNYIREYTPAAWEEFFQSQYENIEDICSRINEPYVPRASMVFNSFYHVAPQDIRVVIMLQDPYPNPSDAVGIALSTNSTHIPNSLENVYKRIKDTIPEFEIPNHGDLREWCKKGIFLVNVSPIAVPHAKTSGKFCGIWKSFSAKLIEYICSKRKNVVFMFLGSKATELKQYVTNHHYALEASHPSGQGLHSGRFPFSGCNIFPDCNKYLEKHGLEPIDWQI